MPRTGVPDELGTGHDSLPDSSPGPGSGPVRGWARRRRWPLVAAALAAAPAVWLAGGPGGPDGLRGLLHAAPAPADNTTRPTAASGPSAASDPATVLTGPAARAAAAAAARLGERIFDAAERAPLPAGAVEIGAGPRAACGRSPGAGDLCALSRRQILAVPRSRFFGEHMRRLHDALVHAGWWDAGPGMHAADAGYARWVRRHPGDGPGAAWHGGGIAAVGYTHRTEPARLTVTWLDATATVGDVTGYDPALALTRDARPTTAAAVVAAIPPGGYAVVLDIQVDYVGGTPPRR